MVLKMKRTVCLLCLLAVGLCLSTQTAKAGEINGNEESVLSAAQGKFEYKGKTYVAKQSYLDQLRNKFMQDDVDLKADEAKEAIAGIYSNVETGVKEGYLEEITADGSDPDQETTDGKATPSDDGSGSTAAQNNTSSQESDTASQPADGKTTQGGGADHAQDSLSTAVPVKAPKGEFHLNMKKAIQAVSITEQSKAGAVHTTIVKNYAEPMAKSALAVVAVVTVITLVMLCIRKKGKLKKILPAALSLLLLIAGVTLGTTSAVTAFGFCSGKVLVNQVAADGYYNQVYKTFHQNTGEILQAAGFPASVLDELLDERTIYLDGKLSLEATFNAKRTKEFMNIQDSVKQTLTDYLVQENYSNAEELSDSIGNIAGLIQTGYSDSLKFSYAEWMKDAKETGQKTCYHYMFAAVLLCVAGLVVQLLSQRYIHRIFRVIGWSCLMPAVACAGASVYYILRGGYKDLALIQADYSNFFSSYLKWNAQLFIGVAGLEILVFVICVLATLSLKKTRKKNPIYRKIRKA